MTNDEVLAIKKMVETLWNLRNDSDSDFIWIDFLQDENFVLASKAVKNLAFKGNQYPPKITEIIEEIDNVRLTSSEIQNTKLKAMIENGYLGENITSHEYQQTLKKIVMWEASGIFPKWLINDINGFNNKQLQTQKKYEVEIKQYEKVMGI